MAIFNSYFKLPEGNLTEVEWNFTKKTGDFDPGVMGNQWFSQPEMMNLATGMILPITRCKVVPS